MQTTRVPPRKKADKDFKSKPGNTLNHIAYKALPQQHPLPTPDMLFFNLFFWPVCIIIDLLEDYSAAHSEG